VTNIQLLLRTVLKYSKATTSETLLGRNEIELGRNVSSPVLGLGTAGILLFTSAHNQCFFCAFFFARIATGITAAPIAPGCSQPFTPHSIAISPDAAVVIAIHVPSLRIARAR
jgi:hypothetical protein